MKKSLVLLSLAYVSSTQCYIDPGTGSYLLQLLAAGLIGMLYGLKSYWGVIKSLFTRKSK